MQAKKAPETASWRPSVELIVFALYALLVGFLTWHHDLSHDELQVWLICRDSPSLAALFHFLRYEGHPSVWFLLLYLPSHLGWSIATLKVFTYLFTLGNTALLLSFRELSRLFRLLALFSFFLFFDFAIVARNYMPAAFLLILALRLLTLERPRLGWAILCLALAVNTHFYALPVVAVLFLAAFFVLPEQRSLAHQMKSRSFWAACAAGLVALICFYFTVRPLPDGFVRNYGAVHHSFFFHFLLAEGKAWQTFIPVPQYYLPQPWKDLLTPYYYSYPVSDFHLAVGGCLLSLAVFTVIFFLYRTAAARVLFTLVSLLTFVEIAVTVHVGALRHYGLLFFAILILFALDMRLAARLAKATPASAGLWQRLRAPVALAILAPQVLLALATAIISLRIPFSGAQQTAAWLTSHHLEMNPLVIEPDTDGVALLGYLGRPSAYYPAYHSQGSATVWTATRSEDNEATVAELDALRQGTEKPVLLISGKPLSAERMQKEHLSLLVAIDRQTMMRDPYFIYQVQ